MPGRDFFLHRHLEKTIFPEVCCEAGGIKPEGISEIQLLMHLHSIQASQLYSVWRV